MTCSGKYLERVVHTLFGLQLFIFYHGSKPCIVISYVHCVDWVIHEMDCKYHHESILSWERESHLRDVHVYVRSHISSLMKHCTFIVYHSCSHVLGLWSLVLSLQYFWVIVFGSFDVAFYLSCGGNYVLLLTPYLMMVIIWFAIIVINYDMLLHGRMLLSLSTLCYEYSVVFLHDGA